MALHVVLLEPEIPWNTGNIGRSCLAAGASLHLVGRLGFSLSERRLRRAGLDYWPRLGPSLHEDWGAFQACLPPGAALLGFSARAPRDYWEAPFGSQSYLVFGRESGGLPSSLRRNLEDRLFRIPARPEARSLNLSTAVGIVLYEALRQARA